MDKASARRAEVLSRLRQFEQDLAHATMLSAARDARDAQDARDVLRAEAEAVGGWKVPSANGGVVELAVYTHAVQIEAAAMARCSAANEKASEAERALDLARDGYRRALLAKDVITRRQQRIATTMMAEVEHRDADTTGDMWLARRRHGSD
ncbi:hypothetical protein [Pseudoxanthomonas sp. PXM02]|uniref:hypothetical protein n=1 Tax=Pseudoxanthomonas sp. PXM02 TaxID=2769294 RepID=UPI00177F59B6|nr:hypothetical protein [Pseudoxanthomonas sp. PXM02]MBD9477418.1 hypothetical protein [Pseudoxanthomonas sp. PXM02]